MASLLLKLMWEYFVSKTKFPWRGNTLDCLSFTSQCGFVSDPVPKLSTGKNKKRTWQPHMAWSMGPQPFWHQGRVSQKAIFPWIRARGGRWLGVDSSTLHFLCTLFLFMYLHSSLFPKQCNLTTEFPPTPRRWGKGDPSLGPTVSFKERQAGETDMSAVSPEPKTCRLHGGMPGLPHPGMKSGLRQGVWSHPWSDSIIPMTFTVCIFQLQK